MREIYYAIYKNSNYKTMVMVSLAEAIIAGRGRFEKDKFILKNKIGLNLFETQILTKICLNKDSRFHVSDYNKWIAFLIKDCILKKYLRKSLVLGPRPTTYFKGQIKENGKLFNVDLIKYIDSRKIDHILKIDASFGKVMLPKFEQLKQEKDIMSEMLEEVMNKGYWVGADRLGKV